MSLRVLVRARVFDVEMGYVGDPIQDIGLMKVRNTCYACYRFRIRAAADPSAALHAYTCNAMSAYFMPAADEKVAYHLRIIRAHAATARYQKPWDGAARSRHHGAPEKDIAPGSVRFIGSRRGPDIYWNLVRTPPDRQASRR